MHLTALAELNHDTSNVNIQNSSMKRDRRIVYSILEKRDFFPLPSYRPSPALETSRAPLHCPFLALKFPSIINTDRVIRTHTQP
jgi:hypothetical protein